MDKKNKRIELRITEENWNRCNQRAKALGINRSEYLENLMDKDIQGNVNILYQKDLVDMLQKISRDTYKLCSTAKNMNPDTIKILLPHINCMEGDMRKLWQLLQ